MTVCVVPLEPLAPGVLPQLADETPLSAAETLELYRAMAADVLVAVHESGGDLLVNYPAPERAASDDPEAAARELVADAGIDPDGGEDAADEGRLVRFEVQAGSTPSARAGNAVTHLLEREGEASAAIVEPTTPLLGRAEIDNAAMRLRSDDVVLGAAEPGRTYYAGFAAAIDFAGAFSPPALATVAERAAAAGLDVGFLPQLGRVTTGVDLCSLLATLRARRAAGRAVPANTAAVVEALGLELVGTGEELPASAEAVSPVEGLQLVVRDRP